MNYEENNIHWKIGDIIIHDCDAKRGNMLMKIIKTYQDHKGQPRYVCAYIDRIYHMGSKGLSLQEFNVWNRWDNSIKPLHDPKRFNLNAEAQRK